MSISVASKAIAFQRNRMSSLLAVLGKVESSKPSTKSGKAGTKSSTPVEKVSVHLNTSGIELEVPLRN